MVVGVCAMSAMVVALLVCSGFGNSGGPNGGNNVVGGSYSPGGCGGFR